MACTETPCSPSSPSRGPRSERLPARRCPLGRVSFVSLAALGGMLGSCQGFVSGPARGTLQSAPPAYPVHGSRSRTVMFQMDPSDNAWRMEHDNSAKWDPRNRAKTRSPEEAERVLRLTGRLPRPLRLSDVKRGAPPLRKTIVANAKERRAAAEMTGIYSVSKLQARLLLNRETHPVWGHERVMVYGKMISEFMVPDVYAQDPIEMSVPLKFRAAFREDAARTEDSSPVNVQIFGESGCPDTTAFIAGPLAEAEQAPGVADIMRLDWTPFGNAYFLTAECGGVPAPPGCGTSASCLYNSTVRTCFFQHCGLGGTPFADCYSPGALHCQHGRVECLANEIEACAKMLDAESSWPISRCIETAFYSGKLQTGNSTPADVHSVAASCGITDKTFEFCKTHGHASVVAMAKATPPHPGVPYVLVNGVVLSETTDLLSKVCKAYAGEKPAGCLTAQPTLHM
ncbi:IFI30 [Symbiodinium pilosum]|uniref:IFI30 protein n=1 Tax=Symbiodinium pilosum TaxID=2952 RepID=A0A812K8M1_SYMPI|nr:IFI30 [Symbiodinium pilosum]